MEEMGEVDLGTDGKHAEVAVTGDEAPADDRSRRLVGADANPADDPSAASPAAACRCSAGGGNVDEGAMVWWPKSARNR